MYRKFCDRFLLITFALIATGGLTAFQVAAQSMSDTSAIQGAMDSVVTILLASDGQANSVGSGLIVRSDGYILTPYSLVRGAREIQIKLRNGEIYDKAEVVSTDERRNVAMLHINASGLRYIPNGTVEETQVGSRIYVVTNPAGQVMTKEGLQLSSVQMADNIQGAGKGYRVLQFDAVAGSNTAGGLILDEQGRSLGIITTTPDIKGQNIAVPLSSVVGLIRSVQTALPITVAMNSTPTPSNTPYPIPQNSVQVPQRGVTPLTAKGPGSVVVKPNTVPEVLAASKTIYVTSETVFFKPQLLVSALSKHDEISTWGLSFVEDRDVADLILEIDHILFTYKFTFKMYSQRLGTVVASGDVIIFDGNLGAPHMADRVVETIAKAKGEDKKTPEVKPKSTPDDKKKKDTK